MAKRTAAGGEKRVNGLSDVMALSLKGCLFIQ
jgi:hypothetical protein